MSEDIVKVPDIGDAADVEVIELNVTPGEQVEKDSTLIVLESDKASMEIPSPRSGTVGAIFVKVGSKVSQGDDILALSSGQEKAAPVAGEAAAKMEEPAESVATPKSVATAAAPAQADAEGGNMSASGKDVEAVAPDIGEASDVEVIETGELLTLKVPDIGDASEVEVIEIAVAVGDRVSVDDTLIVLESDKASMEIPATHAGVVKAVLLEVGQKVKQGAPIVVLTSALTRAPETASQIKQESTDDRDSGALKSATAAPETAAQTAPVKSGELVYAGPAVRMLARELGVDLTQVNASGPRGRILKEDVQNFVKRALSEKTKAPAAGLGIPAAPVIDFSQFGEIKIEPMSRIKKLTATAMHRSWLNVPHVTHFDEADISDLEDFRATKKSQAQERGLKLTPLPFLIKACAAALKKYPQFNVSLAPSGEEIIQKSYCHIGIAMDTPAGLMVPVIRNVDKKGVWELAQEATELGVKGQSGKLSRDDLQGGCFTISSLGSIGGTGFTPIVNTPEVAILGVSKTILKPVYINAELVPRKMLPLALSYDHRAINGVDAGQFMTFLTQVLADIRKLVL